MARTPTLKSAVYYIRPSGQIVLATDEVERANGVQLSPDERVLYTSDTTGEFVVAFDVEAGGTLRNRRDFASVGRGADGLAIDGSGRLYVATPNGIQVLSPRSRLGLIPMPRRRPAWPLPDRTSGPCTSLVVETMAPVVTSSGPGRSTGSRW